MKNISSTIVLLFAMLACNAQTYLEMADEAYANKEYTTALGLYDKALKKPSKSDDLATINFKVAESYRNTGKYDLAIQYYGQAKAAGYTNPNYLFKQGSIYLKQGKYDQAQEKFEAFLAAQPGDKEATLQLNNTKYIKNLPKDSSVFTFKNEAGLNTSFSEYAALPLKNGSVIFTSGRISEKEEKTYSADGQGFSDLYQSTYRSEEHTSELPVTWPYLVCRLLLEKRCAFEIGEMLFARLANIFREIAGI